MIAIHACGYFVDVVATALFNTAGKFWLDKVAFDEAWFDVASEWDRAWLLKLSDAFAASSLVNFKAANSTF